MKLHLLATLAISLSLGACAEGTVTSARFVDPSSGIEVDYVLTGAHVYLAEFHRRLHVHFAHSDVDFPLEMDSGGYLLMNIYRLPGETMLLYDGEDYVAVDSHSETVEQPTSRPDTRTAEYVGCFDWPQGGNLEFIPAAKRPERRPILRAERSASGSETVGGDGFELSH